MKFALPLCTLVLLAACQRDNATHMPGDTGLALATSAQSKDSLILLKDSLLATRQRQLSEQSALLGDAANSARLATEINTTLSKVRNLQVPKDVEAKESAVSTATAELETVHAKVDALVKRLDARSGACAHAAGQHLARGNDGVTAARLRTVHRRVAGERGAAGARRYRC
jgi:hypothetical protein